MKATFLSLFFAFTFLLSTTSAQNLPIEKLDRFLRYLEEDDKWMGSVVIAKGNEPIYGSSIGYRKIAEEESIRADPRTRYRIGSLTKMFTATLIMQLVEDGELDLSTPLSEFYPEIPNSDSITIDRLLWHRSGLHDLTSDPSYRDYKEVERSHDQMLEMFRNMEPDMAPGTKASYSNSNYILLGYIIEKVTESEYSEILQERVLEPIELEATSFGGELEPKNNEALSYEKRGAREWVESTKTDMEILHGAGAITSTAIDLTRYAYALFHEDLVNSSSLEKMKETKEGFGRGIFPMPFHERMGYGHTGGIDGFSSILHHIPEDSLSVAILSNGATYSNTEILEGCLSSIYDKPFELPEFQSVKIPPEALDDYTGVYSSDKLGMELKIEKEDGSLSAQENGQAKVSLSPASRTEFRSDKAGAVLRFREQVDEGKYQKLTFEHGGRTMELVRK